VRLVTVDGLAGSGKTTFAGRLAAALRATATTVGEVHTDDLLAGWTGITTFWQRLEDGVLMPLAAGRPGAYHSYDWGAGRFRSQPTPVPVPDVLIIEGVTGAAAAGPHRRTLAVQVVAARELRLARGIARDGEAQRQHWLRWMRDEETHVAAAPHDPADVVVDGAPTLPHDADREYVESGG
jgi:uridine kinase